LRLHHGGSLSEAAAVLFSGRVPFWIAVSMREESIAFPDFHAHRLWKFLWIVSRKKAGQSTAFALAKPALFLIIDLNCSESIVYRNLR
jgi:hypothetical protein